jgi:trk system potassium uptake protein TrkH
MIRNFNKLKYFTIFKYVSYLITGVGFIMVTPLLSLIFFPQEYELIKFFLFPGILTILIGGIGIFFLRKSEENTITIKEGAFIVTITWILTIFFSALPFYFGRGFLDHNFSFLDSLFESMSGWTTTGLSIALVESTPKIFLFWRSLMQAFGGAGLIVVMMSAIIGPEGSGLYEAEAREGRLVPNVIETTRIILKIYIGYLVLGTILYYLAGMNLFDAINHSMAVLSTGGFSTHSESIGYWDSISIEAVTIFLMFLGTTNFVTHYILLKGKIKKALNDIEIKFLGFLLVFFVPLLSFILFSELYNDFGRSIRISIFELTSALSTTGFSTVSYNDWPIAGVFLLVLFMLIGGGTSSTAGGIKLYRIAIILKNIYWNIKEKLYVKNAYFRRSVYRQGEIRIINDKNINQIFSFISMYIITFLVGVFIFVLNGYPLLDSMFEFASSLGTVGLSIGITSYEVPDVIKIVQIIGMGLGRLEFMAIIISISNVIKDIKNK